MAREARRLARRHQNRLQQLSRAPMAAAVAAARRRGLSVSADLRRLRQYQSGAGRRMAARIAFISNRSGNTALWLIDAVSGKERPLRAAERRYLRPRRELNLQVRGRGRATRIPARISITDSRQRSYAPDDAWIHADDLMVRGASADRDALFPQPRADSRIAVPLDRLAITVSHGPAYRGRAPRRRSAGRRLDRHANGDAQTSAGARLIQASGGAATCTCT